MKRRNIALAAGAVVLTVASAFAGRVSAKFGGNAAALYYTGLGHSTCTFINNVSTSLLTTGGTGAQATLTTQGTNAVPMNLYSTAACHAAKAVHFRG